MSEVDDQPVHIQMNNDSDSEGDEQVRIKIVDSDDSDDDDNDDNHNNVGGDGQSNNKSFDSTTPDNDNVNQSSDDTATTNTQSSPLVSASSTATDPEPWDDSVLDQVQSRDRGNVNPDDQKLMKLRQQHEQKIASAPVSVASQPSKQPDRRLTPSRQEEKRDVSAQPLAASTPSPTSTITPSPSSPNPSSPPGTTSPTPTTTTTTTTTTTHEQHLPKKYIAFTIVHIDLTNIKSTDDIDEAVLRLRPDSTPYEGLIILPPTANVENDIDKRDTPPSISNDKQDNTSVSTTVSDDSTTTNSTPNVAIAASPAPTPKEDPAIARKRKEEEEKKRKEDEKKAKEEEKRKKEEEEKRKKEEEKKSKEDEKKRKEEEKRAKEEEIKRKKEEEKRKKEEEKLAKKNKGKTPTTTTPTTEPSSDKEPSTSTKPTIAAAATTTNDENNDEPSISRQSTSEISVNESATRLGGPTAPCSINYHDTNFPQPITFEQATIILQSQQPSKIPSKFQKANVFGTSGFRKPDHTTCYFYQHLWDTDFDPNNRAHILLLNAFYMYMNDLVITPVFNKDPLNKGSERPEKCEIPEPTGQHWVYTLRASTADRPWAELQGVPARYTILRPLEHDLRPSILPLYLALYLLQGSPNDAFKSLLVALLRQFFQRDNASSNMAYLEIFTPLGYIINSLILSNTTVHAEPFYRLFYKSSLKKDFGQWIPFDDYTLNGFLLAITEYMIILSTTFWFRHLIQQYDYPTLVCAVRQRLLTNIKAEFDRIDSEYCKGGYSVYINDVIHDNYLAQDLKVVFAEQKKQKHLLTPLEAQIHMNQQQRGPGRNSISYTAPNPTTTTQDDSIPKQNKIGPNIVVGKSSTPVNSPDVPTTPTSITTTPTNDSTAVTQDESTTESTTDGQKKRLPPPPRTQAMKMMADIQRSRGASLAQEQPQEQPQRDENQEQQTGNDEQEVSPDVEDDSENATTTTVVGDDHNEQDQQQPNGDQNEQKDSSSQTNDTNNQPNDE